MSARCAPSSHAAPGGYTQSRPRCPTNSHEAALIRPTVADYRHTQVGAWSLILLPIGVVALAVATAARHEPVALLICLPISVLLLFVSLLFHHLTVADEGDHLSVRFGPLPCCCKRIPYDQIRDVEVGKTLLLEGWGIHKSPRGGWVWNVWGWDCVVIHREQGAFRVGTDDAAGLADFLKRRIGRR